MSLKLSLALFSFAALGGGIFTAIAGHAVGDPEGLSQATTRQGRLMASSVLADPAAVAEQIRKAQAGQGVAQPLQPTQGAISQEGDKDQQAQAAPAQTAPQPGSPPPSSNSTDQPDLTALRYFASRGDNVRLQAEIARLQALYPNWTPPSDPLAIPADRDQQLDSFWKLYSEGRYAEVRRAVSERQAAEPGWQPPQDLMDRLALAETRMRLTNASDSKQYATVISLAAATPSLLNCSDVDVLWRVAEAFVQTDRAQRGADAYSYILQNCADPQQRLATVQKASSLLSPEVFKPLLAFERNGEFATLRDDLARQFVAKANEKPGTSVDASELERLRAAAERDQRPADMLLLGWYALRHDDMTEAEKWFRAARQKEDTASAAQGLALVLIDKKASAEAEDVMYRWRDDSEEAAAVYLAASANLLSGSPPPELDEAVLQRIAETVIEKKYVPAAQQLGWYARGFNQPQTAARWFETALRWKPDDEPSAYGLAITRQQLNDRSGVTEIQRTWAGRSDRIANLGTLNAAVATNGPAQVVVSQPAQAVPRTEAPVRQAVDMQPRLVQPTNIVTTTRRTCSATDNAAGFSPQEALVRGWCLMDINRPLEAAEAFQVALSSSSNDVRQDASYGQSLAYLRLGLTSKAAVAATKAPQRPERSAELQIAILADRANAAFNSKRFREAIVFLDQRALLQPETSDLMVLRAYALMNLGQPQGALRIFEAVAETGNREAIKGVADARAAMN